MNSITVKWKWLLALRHLQGRYSRPGLRWINFFAFAGITLGVLSWVTVMSVMDGLQSDIKDKILKEKPHLLWEGTPLQGKSTELSTLFNSHSGEIREIKLLLQTEGLLEREIRKGVNPSSPVIIRAVEGLRVGTIEVGIELAQILKLDVGENLSLRSAWDLERYPLSLQFSNIVETGIYELDKNLVRVSREDLSQWLQMGDAVSRVELYLKNPLLASDFRERIKGQISLPLKTWDELDAALLYSLRLERNMMGLSVFFVILLSTLALSMGMAVRVTEKRRVIGLLRALGADFSEIRGVFLRETLILTFLAVILGVSLSWLICYGIQNWAPIPSFYYGRGIPVNWSLPLAIKLGLCVMILAILAAWVPLKKGLELEPVEALNS